MTIRPLNGSKTHPLTEHSKRALRTLRHGPQPRQDFNAGVVNRLEREALVEHVDLPSPYPTHKGRKIPFLRITDAGRAALAE